MKLLQELAYQLTIKPRLNKLKKLLLEASIHPCGSRYVCNPPVFGTDIDFLVYCESDLDKKLLASGYDKTVFIQYFGEGQNSILTVKVWLTLL